MQETQRTNDLGHRQLQCFVQQVRQLRVAAWVEVDAGSLQSHRKQIKHISG